MNMWLIGGGIYALTSLFALALCRVASPTNETDTETRASAGKPTNVSADFEQLLAKAETTPTL